MSPFRGSVPLTQEWRHFRFESADGIATVTLDRPDKLNALTFDTYADLRDLLAELPHRGETGVPALAAVDQVAARVPAVADCRDAEVRGIQFGAETVIADGQARPGDAGQRGDLPGP